MSRALIVHGLNRPAFKKEVTMGVAPITEFKHDGTTKIIGLEQTVENPYNPTDTHNQEQIKVTRGSHIQSKATIRNGRKDTALDVTTAINKNDFISTAYRFLQVYSYGGKLFETTATAITNTTVSTITLDSTAGIAPEMEINISGRADSTEDKIYNIKSVNGSNITIDGLLDDSDTTGAFDSTIGVHTLKAQADDCNKYLEASSSLWLPNDFPNPANECGANGELVTGLAPLALNLDLMAATAQITMRGKDYIREYADQPKYTTDTNTTDYLEPLSDKEGFMSTEAAVLEWKDGTEWKELDTDALTCNIVMGTNEESKVFRANRFSRVIVDGIDIGGSYGAPVFEVDDDNSISNSIIDKRGSEENDIEGRVKLINEDGTGFYLEGNITFKDPTRPQKDLGGFVFSTDYMFTTSENYQNVEMTIFNNYTEDLTSYL